MSALKRENDLIRMAQAIIFMKKLMTDAHKKTCEKLGSIGCVAWNTIHILVICMEDVNKFKKKFSGIKIARYIRRK